MTIPFRPHYSWIVLITTLFLSACSSGNIRGTDIPREQYVVMLSMDGCRWDYPQMADMPNLMSIAREGVKAESLQPSFPSKTFPNHYTLATGLYPDHHGIVQNSFYDPDMDAYYKISDREAVENPEFYEGEPIWVTAEKQGLKTASYFWVGTEAPIQGIRPSISKIYDHGFPFEARVDSVIAWLQLPKKKRPRLITWYFHEPDGVGHTYGPESPETKSRLEYLDSLVGDFLIKLDALPIAPKVNVIVLSDHGMARISNDKTIFFDDYIESTWLDTSIGSNPVWMFDPKTGFEDSVYFALKEAPHLRVWYRDSIPEDLHYGTHPRVMEIVATPDINWSIDWRTEDRMDQYKGGTHGYDPHYKDMHAIFYAKGPVFKKGYVHPGFENVHVYSLIARILDLEPAPTDGSLTEVKDMLKPTFLSAE